MDEKTKCQEVFYPKGYEFVFCGSKLWNDTKICFGFKYDFCHIVLLFWNAYSFIFGHSLAFFAILGWKISIVEILLSPSTLQSRYQHNNFESYSNSFVIAYSYWSVHIWIWRYFHEGFFLEKSILNNNSHFFSKFNFLIF